MTKSDNKAARSVGSAMGVAMLLLTMRPTLAEQPEVEKATGKVYLLGCSDKEDLWKLPPQGIHWQTLHKLLDLFLNIRR